MKPENLVNFSINQGLLPQDGICLWDTQLSHKHPEDVYTEFSLFSKGGAGARAHTTQQHLEFLVHLWIFDLP